MEPLKVDDEQLRVILEAIGKERATSFWTAERVLQIFQTVSLLCVAAWTLLQYLSYVRPEQELRLKQEDLALKQVNFNYRESQEGRVSDVVTVSIKPTERKDEAIATTLAFRITNTSRNTVTVSWVLVHCYAGSFDQSKRINLLPLRINDPPVSFIKKAEDGPVQWQECGHIGFFYPKTTIKKQLDNTGYNFTEGGGGTKQLEPGDSSGLTDYFIVTRAPDRWIGFVIVVGLDDALEGKNIRHSVRILPTMATIGDGEKSQRSDDRSSVPEARSNSLH